MLQGSLDNFALDEVLGLLASTTKTGQLEISGDRGTGTLSFNEGRLIDGKASHSANGTGVEDIMFELLRYSDGTFTFTNRDVDPGDQPQQVATVLATAETRLTDWRQIEAVVPSLQHQVTPTATLPSDEVTINREEWAVLVVVAAGCPASQVCDALNLGEVEGSRQIKLLAERDLLTISEPAGGLGSRSSSSLGGPSTTAPSGFGSDESAVVAGAPGMPPASGLGDSAMTGLDQDPLAASPDPIASTAPPAPLNEQPPLPAPSAETDDRPPMPPPPTADDLSSTDAPAPPSPAEISQFRDELDDAAELVEEADAGKNNGLLARYRKSDD